MGLIHRLATPTHLSEIVPHVDVQQTLEHKDAEALQGVQDGECVGKVDVVEGKVEEAENPGGPQEEDEQDDPFDIGEQQLDIHRACVELVEDNGVEGVDEEAKVDADDNGSRNDEGEDEVIVDSKPAKI